MMMVKPFCADSSLKHEEERDAMKQNVCFDTATRLFRAQSVQFPGEFIEFMENTQTSHWESIRMCLADSKVSSLEERPAKSV